MAEELGRYGCLTGPAPAGCLATEGPISTPRTCPACGATVVLTLRSELEEVRDVLVDLVAELRREIDRGRLGSGWIASNVPAFYRAEELVR